MSLESRSITENFNMLTNNWKPKKLETTISNLRKKMSEGSADLERSLNIFLILDTPAYCVNSKVIIIAVQKEPSHSYPIKKRVLIDKGNFKDKKHLFMIYLF